MSDHPKKRFLNSKLWTLIKIIFAVGLFIYVFMQADFEQLLGLQARFDWGWVGVTFLAFLGMLLIKTYQYYIFIGRKLNYFRLLEIVVIQNALMNFVATAAGIASYLTMLGVEEDVRLGKATESFVLVKIGDVVAVSLYLLFSLPFISPLPEGAVPVVFVVAFAALAFLLILLAALFLRERFLSLFQSILARFKLTGLRPVQSLLTYFEKIVAHPRVEILRVIGQASLISLAYMGMTMLWGYGRFESFSFSLNFFVVVFVLSLVQFASWVPIYIFGGLGLSEGIWISLLGLFSSQTATLAAILIGIRVLNYALNALTLLYLPLYAAFGRTSAVK